MASTQERVYERVRGMLREHTLKPDARVNISDMATELDASIIPTREALARLAAEGLLERPSAGGFKVPGLSVANVVGDFTVVFLFFRHVTDLAFEHEETRLTVVQHVERQNDRLVMLADEPDAVAAEAEEYTLGLLPITRSAKLKATVEAAIDASTIYRRVYYRRMVDRGAYLEGRRAYEDALRRSDEDAARKMVRGGQQDWETRARELCRYAWTELFDH